MRSGVASVDKQQLSICQICSANKARLYEMYVFSAVSEPVEPEQIWLCVKCARRERQARREARAAQLRNPNYATSPQLSRDELIATLDRFWAESGAGEICRCCHAQGTGCCPPPCRHLSAQGCRQKNVFCTSFVCSALLMAIAECDAETARLLKWIKAHPGAAEFRIYEMVTRVPAIDRETTRPLALPDHYPGPLKLEGNKIKTQLTASTQEILEIRRRWRQEELQPYTPAETEPV
jgi:hypothetical protein